MQQPAVSARGVVKTYNGVAALKGIDVTVMPGERHAVLGENGAGKSTLMRILTGLESADSGDVRACGVPIDGSPHSARRAGIALVHQERSLVLELSVAENIALGSLPTVGGVIVSRRGMRREAQALLARVGVDVDPGRRVSQLSSAQQHFVEIAKALRQEPKVLILDEPSASMTPQETKRLLGLLHKLSDAGIAIVYVSHRMPEIYDLCTSATVLRDGSLVGRFDLDEVPREQLVERMVGRELRHDLREKRASRPGSVVLRVDDLYAEGVDGVSFELRAGEILGFGGLVGAGRTEIVRAVIGLNGRISGHVQRVGDGGSASTLGRFARAVRQGVAYVPEERRSEGVLLEMSIQDNLTLPTRGRTSRLGFGRLRDRRAQSEDAIRALSIKCAGPDQAVGRLSGGNQQKVAFGKWLAAHPSILVLDEPTRGVDVGAKAEIHQLIRAEADRGVGVLMVSSDLPELLALADRILVVKDGQIVGSVHGEGATEPDVMRLAVG
jgi:ABC-type sugar transport system ATPase subunit